MFGPSSGSRVKGSAVWLKWSAKSSCSLSFMSSIAIPLPGKRLGSSCSNDWMACLLKTRVPR